MVQSNGTALKMTDIHDLKAPESIGFDPVLFHYILYIVLGIIILGLLIILFLYLKKKKRNKADPVIPVSPDEAAFKAIDDLARQVNGDGKTFYFNLSTILRGYIHGRFGIGSLEMTTEELVPGIEKLDIDRRLKSGIRKFLISADPVKFAGYPTRKEKMENDLLFAKDFVKQTTSIAEDIVK